MKLCRKTWSDDSASPAHQVLFRGMRLMKLHRTVLDREFNKTGVYRSQHQILMIIASNPNASQRDIAQHMNVSTATIAVSLKKLERGGYIQRIVDQSDNRFNQICLTDAGNTVVERSRLFFEKVEEQMFHNFTEEELMTMKNLLDRVCQNLSLMESGTEQEA